MKAFGWIALPLSAGLALALLAQSSNANSPIEMPHPSPNPRTLDPVKENAGCVSCHQEIATEWKASQHAQAHTDPVYQRALAIEPLAFCRGCHAPEADASKDPPAALGALGIGCVTCHEPSGAPGSLAAPSAPINGDAGAPKATHPLLRDARFAAADACARCHEFAFPDRAYRKEPLLMQSTASEHALSKSSSVPCAACHMKPVTTAKGTHRNHAFVVLKDPVFLASAVRVNAKRTTKTELTLTLSPGTIGHAFPTGDLFRRLLVEMEMIDASGTVLGSHSDVLAREFDIGEIAKGIQGRIQKRDRRVGMGSASGVQTLAHDFGPKAEALKLRYRVRYERVEHPVGSDASRAVVADSIVVASGEL